MIVFVDETGWSFQEKLTRTWAPRGCPPVLHRVGAQRRAFSTMIGLGLDGRVFTRHFKGSVGSAGVVLFLKHLMRHQPGPLTVVWDGASIHRARLVRQFLAQQRHIQVETLPRCAPELNPEEGAHGWVKRRLANLTPRDETEYRRHVNSGFACLRRRPDVVLGCLHHAGLRVNQLW